MATPFCFSIWGRPPKRRRFGAESVHPGQPHRASTGHSGAQWDQTAFRAPVSAPPAGRTSRDGAPRTRSHWSQHRASCGPPGTPRPPDRPEADGREPPKEPVPRTPAHHREQNGHVPMRKTLTGSRRGPHRGGESSRKNSGENANPHLMVGLDERSIRRGLGIGKT